MAKRIIKFRGYSERMKKMLYGGVLIDNEKLYIIQSLDKNYEMYERVEYAEQFTGLHDKNGKEIYEGDITNLGEVYWEKEISCWNIKNFYDSMYDYPSIAFSEGTEKIEVIGNIHEGDNND